MSRPALTLIAPLLALLAGCAQLPAGDNGPPLVLPPALHAEGVPPLPMRLVEAVRPYTTIAGHALVDVHPQRAEMVVAHRPPDASITQIFRLRAPMAALEPLTRGADPVSSADWEPGQGRFLVFSRSRGGDEANQLYRLDPDSGAETRLTAPDRRHALLGWLPGSRLLVASVPLDRTAAGGRREQLQTELAIVDPLAPEAARLVARLDGIGWFAAAVAADGRRVALGRARSSTDSEVWTLDLEAGPSSLRKRLPATDAPTASVRPDAFSADGRHLFLRSDAAGEFRELVRLDLASGAVQRLSAHIPWDIGSVEASPDGRRLAVLANAGGRSTLHLFDAASGAELAFPAAAALAGADVARVRWADGGRALALQIAGAGGPAQIHRLSLDASAVQAWTQPAGVDRLKPAQFAQAEAVRWTGVDGLALSGWMHRPDPRRFPGPRPVLMLVHGGPASQADAGWIGRYHYLVEERGVAVIQPNVRGSSGFGKTFVSLDDGWKREDSVKDLGRLLDWIATQPLLDASRVVVMGGSYGGYMSLAASVHFADRIAGAVSTVGISNFVSFLERTESYRRDLRRTEYGDERDPAMRAFLQRISPLNNVERITKPLLVVQGRNDPRVPWTESEQIVRRLQQRGQPVWYLLADNEGHGFARRENAEAYFATVVRFLDHVWTR